MDRMTHLLQVWEKENGTTRKVLARIPEGSDYRPDPKSRTAREIAWLIVREQIALAEGLERGTLEWVEVPAPATVQEVLAAFDSSNTVGRLRAIDASRWNGPVPFVFGGREDVRNFVCGA